MVELVIRHHRVQEWCSGTHNPLMRKRLHDYAHCTHIFRIRKHLRTSKQTPIIYHKLIIPPPLFLPLIGTIQYCSVGTDLRWIIFRDTICWKLLLPNWPATLLYVTVFLEFSDWLIKGVFFTSVNAILFYQRGKMQRIRNASFFPSRRELS